jgi:hypothetical protein
VKPDTDKAAARDKAATRAAVTAPNDIQAVHAPAAAHNGGMSSLLAAADFISTPGYEEVSCTAVIMPCPERDKHC